MKKFGYWKGKNKMENTCPIIKMKLTKEDLENSKITQLDWDVCIQGRLYYAVQIENCVHHIVKCGILKDIWVYPRDEKMHYTNLIPYMGECPVEWSITTSYSNKIILEHDNLIIKNIDIVSVIRNGKIFYRVPENVQDKLLIARDVVCFCKSQVNTELDFECINFDNKFIGRKVWFYGQPGKVVYYHEGNVNIIPDGISYFHIDNRLDREYFLNNITCRKNDITVTTFVGNPEIIWDRMGYNCN